jgi:predicted ester cyclase
MKIQDKKTGKEIALAYAQRVWDHRDLSAIDELLHPNCVIHSLLGDFHGPASMKQVVQAWLRGFPNLAVKNIASISENDLVAIQWQAQGLHEGEFKGIPPTGKPVVYAGVTLYRVRHAKIVEYWAYIDMQHLLKQISSKEV